MSVDPWAAPRDELAERAVLGEVLHTHRLAADVAAIIDPADIWTPWLRTVAEVCWDLTERGLPCDAVSVRAQCQRLNAAVDPVDLAGLIEHGVPGVVHARRVHELAVRRRLIEHASRAVQQAADPACDARDVAAQLHVHALILAESGDPVRPVHARTAAQFLAGPTDYEWLVPGLLERGDRLLLTGAEGGGKSVLSRQIAVAVAAGAHPFGGRPHEPRRTLLVDLENGDRPLRRHLSRLVTIAGRAPETLWVEERQAGLDVTRAEDEQWLRGVCDSVAPDLLVIGPLYRMHSGDMSKEESARHLTVVLDGLRARHGCAVVMETHAPHGTGLGQRDLRPLGSSLFRRWPEFGLGLRTKDEDVTDLVSWRGGRDDRDWPRQLRRGGPGEWPWVDASDQAIRRFWSQEVTA